MDDYYKILGIEKNATADEIKRKYRVLAGKYHPDKHGGDPEMEKKFKEINVAYETLGDSEKRAMYDKYGKDWEQAQHAGFGDGGFGFEDAGGAFFSSIFGDGGFFGWSPNTIRGHDLSVEAEVSLEDVMKGTSLNLRINREEKCNNCDGSGADGGPANVKTCKTCRGSGRTVRRSGPMVMETICHDCKGNGSTIKSPCRVCRGEGGVRISDTVAVAVPAGINHGQRLKLKGKGSFVGGACGDLYVIIHVISHRFFKRDGNDLIFELPISFVEASLGCNKIVPDLLQGSRNIQIKEGTDSGSWISIKGAGIPKLGSSYRGEMRIFVVVETPKKLSNEQRALLLEFDGMQKSSDNYPKTSGLWDKIKSLFV